MSDHERTSTKKRARSKDTATPSDLPQPDSAQNGSTALVPEDYWAEGVMPPPPASVTGGRAILEHHRRALHATDEKNTDMGKRIVQVFYGGEENLAKYWDENPGEMSAFARAFFVQGRTGIASVLREGDPKKRDFVAAASPVSKPKLAPHKKLMKMRFDPNSETLPPDVFKQIADKCSMA